ncbi:MarR family transcriptional regulator [Streptomyces sp. NPDC007084]|uniref:MarR family winged helix-turn-helix transcriptional regulator n=1 Tax=Streptomyces sp. NPDC007084 TaxID=3154313 RepID=UPI0034539737
MHQDYGDKLVWLSSLIQRRYAQICAGHDLTPAQATLLCAVKDEPQRMGGLAASLGITKNALTQLVDRTERRGLVRRDSREPDRRITALSVTAAGKELAEAVYAEVTKRLPDIADVLDADDQRHLERIATAMVEASASPARDTMTSQHAKD